MRRPRRNHSPAFKAKVALAALASVDTSNPAIAGHGKTGHHTARVRDAGRVSHDHSACKSVRSFVRQLRGPHLRMCA